MSKSLEIFCPYCRKGNHRNVFLAAESKTMIVTCSKCEKKFSVELVKRIQVKKTWKWS